jgi:hypothetical protein
MFIGVLIAIGQSILVGIVMLYIGHRQEKNNKVAVEQATARRQDNILLLQLVMASAKLSYACAIALKRGVANGEVEEGVAAYNEASKKYDCFLRDTAAAHLEH